MKRYRATLFDRQRTCWKPTREEAIDAAIAKGWASRDEHVPSRIYFGVGVKIERDGQ